MRTGIRQGGGERLPRVHGCLQGRHVLLACRGLAADDHGGLAAGCLSGERIDWRAGAKREDIRRTERGGIFLLHFVYV